MYFGGGRGVLRSGIHLLGVTEGGTKIKGGPNYGGHTIFPKKKPGFCIYVFGLFNPDHMQVQHKKSLPPKLRLHHKTSNKRHFLFDSQKDAIDASFQQCKKMQ